MSKVKKCRKDKKKLESSKPYMNRDKSCLALLADAPNNRELIDLFNKTHAALVSGEINVRQRSMLAVLENKIWKEIQALLPAVVITLPVETQKEGYNA